MDWNLCFVSSALLICGGKYLDGEIFLDHQSILRKIFASIEFSRKEWKRYSQWGQILRLEESL